MGEEKSSVKVLENVTAGARQVAEAVKPSGIVEKGEKKEFIRILPQEEILERARSNRALTPEDVKAFLNNTEQELAALEKVPEGIRFSLEQGVKGAEKRRQQLTGVLTQIGIEEVKIGEEKFPPDEVWDAVIYDARKANDKGEGKDHGLKLLEDKRGQRIAKNAAKITEKISKEKSGAIYELGRAVEAQEIDALSVTSNRLNISQKDLPFKLHQKQKPSDTEIDVRAVLVVRKKLQRIDVVQAFLNQRAGGWVGQTGEPKPGEPQLPDQISWNEDNKQVIVQGVPFSGDPNHLTVVEMLDVLEDGERMFEELKDQLQGGTQGRSGWIAEAVLRRLNEVWTETSDIKQKAIAEIKTWVSQLGRGHYVAKFLEIPDVGRILAWQDWYQQRDPLTDQPLPIDDLPTIEARVKEKARNAGIPIGKVDLALYLSRILQLGYWPGRVGYKHRVFTKRYAFEDLGASIPKGFFPEEEKVLENTSRAERIAFEAYIADLDALTVGHLTDYAAEHLHRVVDNAVTEDILYRWEVGDAPIYRVPPDEIIKLLSQNQKIPFQELKQMFTESFLHREQWRWLFVWARMGGLYQGWEYRIGEKASEKQYLNPTKKEDRQALINYLQTHDTAIKVLAEAGIQPEWITDAVVEQLFTDENMEAVNEMRRDRGPKVDLTSFKVEAQAISRLPDTNQIKAVVLAQFLEFVLRDKRTWGVDMGVNNDLLAKPELPREIREKGGFGADEMGAMVVMEFNRSDIHDTWKTWLSQLARYRLKNEFPDLKAQFAAITTQYGDEPRWRADSAAAPYLPAITALGILSKDMLAGYFLMGYEATAGGMVTSQLHLSDVLDQMRILYWHKPVIGAYKRIFGRETHLNWMDRLKLLQRADLYNALDTRWEELFQSAPDLNQILSHKIVGGSGKAMYFHCVRRINPDGREGDIILRTDPDEPGKDGYWVTRNKREARHFYFPATLMVAAGMESQALQGKLDREEAKKQIDSLVSVGFMRRWYNENYDPVGLGDLFQAEFTVYADEQGTTPQKKVFPIDFMIDLRQQARVVAVEFAKARGLPYYNQFWELARTNQLRGTLGEAAWKEFRVMMLDKWLINVDEPESEMAQFYWEWREQALEMLHLTEEGLEKIPTGGVFGAIYRFKTRTGELAAGALSFLRSGGGWAEQYVSQHRGDFERRLKEDPVREELGRIEENFAKFIIEEVREKLTRANEKGLFLGEKLQIRKSIEEHYRSGKIDRNTRDMLLTEVITKSYRPSWKDFKDPDFWINAGFSIPSLIWNIAGGLVENLAKIEMTKQLWFAQIESVLAASPAGYTISIVSTAAIPSILRAASAVGDVIKIGFLELPSLGTLWQIFLLVQSSAIVGSNLVKVGNWAFRKINKGKGIATGDALVTRQERKGQ